jgi:hypothetical protein
LGNDVVLFLEEVAHGIVARLIEANQARNSPSIAVAAAKL